MTPFGSEAFKRWETRHREGLARFSRWSLAALSTTYGSCLMLVFILIAMRFVYLTHHSAQWVHHTLVVKDTIQKLHVEIGHASYHHRDFIITERRSSRESYRESIYRAWKTLEDVRHLTADNRSQQERCRSLDAILNAKFAFMSRSADDRVDSGFDAARRRIVGGQGERLMEQAERTLDAMTDAEDMLLARREAGSEWWATCTWLALLGIAGRDLALLYVMVREIWRRRHALPVIPVVA